MENFVFIVLYMALGYILRIFGVFSSGASDVLNKFVIYVSLPAMILLFMPKIEFSTALIAPLVISWSVFALSIALTLFLSRWFGFSRQVEGALMLVSALGNTSFVGIPLIDAYFGKEGMPYLVVYDQLGSFLLFVTYGSFAISYYTINTKIDMKSIIKQIVFFPPFISLVASLFLFGIEYPKSIEYVLQFLSDTITPFTLIAVGLQLRFKIQKEDLNPFLVSMGVKLIAAPFFAFLVALVFGYDGLGRDVSIIESGMPAMITAGAMASMAGLAPRLTNAIVGYGIVFSLFSTYAIYRILITSFV